jgi:hypothetical protein
MQRSLSTPSTGNPERSVSAMPIIAKQTSGAMVIFWPIDEARDNGQRR